MPNFLINSRIKSKQVKTLLMATSFVFVIVGLMLMLLMKHESKKVKVETPLDLTGIVDESFTEANVDSALRLQQEDVDALKQQMTALQRTIADMSERQQSELKAQALQFKKELHAIQAMQLTKAPTEQKPQELKENLVPTYWHPQSSMRTSLPGAINLAMAQPNSKIHAVSFRVRKKTIPMTHHLNPQHYVPSNTSVQAVILGGADADASVNGQSKNNGVMLFKFLENGTLPNGQRSRLRGCRVSANAYGDISSERAFATLYRLSCAHPGEPIIDKEVTGWVFFNGKVGIKGKPLMRDNKVMTWAGVSGALSGIASAAQYAQSAQSIGPYGATSVVPSGNIGPYAAYGGASKAADTLSQYYVKRAEQYHPVIQVGSGNVVTIVFKDGFYLEADEDIKARASDVAKDEKREATSLAQQNEDALNFTVPPEVLSQLDKSQSSNGVSS